MAENPHVAVWQLYQPLLGAVLAGWERANIYLILDGTCVGKGRWTVWRFSIAHGCRAFPVAWMVTAGTGSVSVERLEPMLRAVATWVQGRVRQVTFLADRGFHDYRWSKLARELGWDYAIRLPCSTTVTLRDGRVRRIDDLGVAVGKSAFFQAVRVTAKGQWQAHLAITWTTPTAKPEIQYSLSRGNVSACHSHRAAAGRAAQSTAPVKAKASAPGELRWRFALVLGRGRP